MWSPSPYLVLSACPVPGTVPTEVQPSPSCSEADVRASDESPAASHHDRLSSHGHLADADTEKLRAWVTCQAHTVGVSVAEMWGCVFSPLWGEARISGSAEAEARQPPLVTSACPVCLSAVSLPTHFATWPEPLASH